MACSSIKLGSLAVLSPSVVGAVSIEMLYPGAVAHNLAVYVAVIVICQALAFLGVVLLMRAAWRRKVRR